MKPTDIDRSSEFLWFAHIAGIYQPQLRDIERPGEELFPGYVSETDHHQDGEE